MLTRPLPQNLNSKSLGWIKNKKGPCKICFIYEKTPKFMQHNGYHKIFLLHRYCQMNTCQFHLKSLFNLILIRPIPWAWLARAIFCEDRSVWRGYAQSHQLLSRLRSPATAQVLTLYTMHIRARWEIKNQNYDLATWIFNRKLNSRPDLFSSIFLFEHSLRSENAILFFALFTREKCPK